MRITSKPPIGSTIRVPSIGICGVVTDKPRNRIEQSPNVIWAVWTYEKNGELMSGGTPLCANYNTNEVFLVDPPEDILWD